MTENGNGRLETAHKRRNGHSNRIVGEFAEHDQPDAERPLLGVLLLDKTNTLIDRVREKVKPRQRLVVRQ